MMSVMTTGSCRLQLAPARLLWQLYLKLPPVSAAAAAAAYALYTSPSVMHDLSVLCISMVPFKHGGMFTSSWWVMVYLPLYICIVMLAGHE